MWKKRKKSWAEAGLLPKQKVCFFFFCGGGGGCVCSPIIHDVSLCVPDQGEFVGEISEKLHVILFFFFCNSF